MNQTPQRRPRTWVLVMVRATLAFTVLGLLSLSIAEIWVAEISSDSIWWVVYALPQVSVALLAILLCWAPDTRPTGLGFNVGYLNMFGIIFSIIFWKWPLMVVGALTIVAMKVRPRGKPMIFESPPPAILRRF